MPQDVVLPLEFEAFYLANVDRYRGYAQVRLADAEFAEDVVYEVFARLAANWSEFLRQASPAAWAWRLLRFEVNARAARQDSRTEEVSRVLRQARATLETSHSELGLFSAISALPERLFDVVVLQYVLGYSADLTGDLLGISPTTVRSASVSARRRLAVLLNMPVDELRPAP
ncbi:sigma-70 family RNA polymerase sigma factor [Kitasatospora sp. NPDC088346]|uniref:sigma-70 family RNA polymerase sigma factor n=1 Tax=Kitasatospora sp. NPDC088346 TaxID=3364073 RepID=UPI00380FF898